jgi:hypothetical protein
MPRSPGRVRLIGMPSRLQALSSQRTRVSCLGAREGLGEFDTGAFQTTISVGPPDVDPAGGREIPDTIHVARRADSCTMGTVGTAGPSNQPDGSRTGRTGHRAVTPVAVAAVVLSHGCVPGRSRNAGPEANPAGGRRTSPGKSPPFRDSRCSRGRAEPARRGADHHAGSAVQDPGHRRSLVDAFVPARPHQASRDTWQPVSHGSGLAGSFPDGRSWRVRWSGSVVGAGIRRSRRAAGTVASGISAHDPRVRDQRCRSRIRPPSPTASTAPASPGRVRTVPGCRFR